MQLSVFHTLNPIGKVYLKCQRWGLKLAVGMSALSDNTSPSLLPPPSFKMYNATSKTVALIQLLQPYLDIILDTIMSRMTIYEPPFVIKEHVKGMTSLFPPIMPVLFSVLSDGYTPSRSAHSEPPQKPLHQCYLIPCCLLCTPMSINLQVQPSQVA